MTLEQIDIAIAEYLGWSDIKVGEGARIWGNRPNSAGQDYRKAAVPQFHACLNAMHWAEKTLDYNELNDMEESVSFHFGVTPFHSTAAQRAEAFLKAIGKWQEPDKLSTHIAV